MRAMTKTAKALLLGAAMTCAPMFGALAAGGTTSITSSDFTSGQTEYEMPSVQDKRFAVQYTNNSGTESTVLVVECPEYGTTYAAVPGAGDVVQEVLKLDSHRIAIRLKDSTATVEYFATFSLIHVVLTDAQAADLIDNNMPATRIAVTEYKHAGALSDVLTSGEQLAETVYCSMKASISDQNVNATHTYAMGVSAIPTTTDYMLSRSFEYATESAGDNFTPVKVGGYRFRLPETYLGSPVEITAFKLYAPSAKLTLSSIASHTGTSGNTLLSSMFDRQYTGWEITPGSDEYGEYYLLTLPEGVRLFNNGALGKDEYFFGFSPIWQLKDRDDPLEYASDRYTDYQGHEGALYYKLPGDTTARSLTVAGPLVKVWARGTRKPRYTFNGLRDKSSSSYSDVVAGIYKKEEAWVSVFNSYYRGTQTVSGESVVTEFFPEYTGAVTQTLEFPYQIQPTKIAFYSMYQGAIRTSQAKKDTKLLDIIYTTMDGEEHHVTEDEINAINAGFARVATGSAGTAELNESENEFNPVTKVVLKWEALATEYRFMNNLADNHYVAELRFDYRTNNYTDSTRSDRLPTRSPVQVKYTVDYGTDDDGTTYDQYVNENVLWFRLIPPRDPYLIGYGQNLGDISPLDDGVRSVGSVRFYVGTSYGEYRDIPYPVINFSTRFWEDGPYYTAQNTFHGITEAEGLAFLTGAFTAGSKLAGWTFDYTTLKHPEGLSYTVQPEELGQTVRLLEADDYFTSLKLSYDGIADMSWEGSEHVYLMSNIGIRRLTTNPFTGEPITINDFERAVVRIWANYTYADCVCEKQHDTGTWMRAGGSGSGYVPLLANMFGTRKARLITSGTIPTGGTIYQGSSIANTWTFTARPWTVSPTPYTDVYDRDAFYYNSTRAFPWTDVREAVYFELTDPEFVFDPAATSFYGYPATDSVVEYEVVTIEGRTFLKLQFAPNFRRVRVYNTYNRSWENSGTYGWRAVGDEVSFYPAPQGSGGRWTRDNYTAAGPCIIGFKTVPGTQLGEHHPIGDVYLDFSGLLVNYRAVDVDGDGNPIKTGYDSDMTKYAFSGDGWVEDTLGLSWTDGVDGVKLFKIDGRAYTVKVELSLEAGVELAPGKDATLFDFSPRTTVFRTGEEGNLNALVTFKGPGSDGASTIYDMSGVIVLPRDGKLIHWVETTVEGGVITTTEHDTAGDMDLFLRGAPAVVSNNTGATPVYAYTTADDPTAETADWRYDPTAAGNSWRAVTGVKITLATVPPLKSMNLRLDLLTEAKTTIDVKKAFGGGVYRYLRSETDTEYVSGCLPLCEWDYENYAVTSGFVFWDVYDENGVRTIQSGSTYRPQESPISGVAVTLYDRDGTTVVDETVSDADGRFAFRTYKPDAGQIVEIGLPSVTDGSEPRLTKQSTTSPVQSAADSDFDRETRRLELGELGVNGIANISAGFVKLPKLAAADVTIPVGDTADLSATLTEFYRSQLPADSYNVTFTEAVDPTVAMVAPGTVVLNGNDTNASPQATTARDPGVITVTGVKPGTTTATVTTTNRLGDEVTATYTITVQFAVFGEKTWDDEDDRYGLRPDTITVNLLADGEVVDTKTVGEADGWKWNFGVRPEKGDDGHEIVYAITEDPVEGYDTEIVGFDAKNTVKVETDVTVVVKWDDGGDILGTRGKSGAKVVLKKTEKGVTTEVGTADVGTTEGEWSRKWEDLPVFDDEDKLIVYSVTESFTEQERDAAGNPVVSDAKTHFYVCDLGGRVGDAYGDAEIPGGGSKTITNTYSFQFPERVLVGSRYEVETGAEQSGWSLEDAADGEGGAPRPVEIAGDETGAASALAAHETAWDGAHQDVRAVAEGLQQGLVLKVSGYAPSRGAAAGRYENGSFEGAVRTVLLRRAGVEDVDVTAYCSGETEFVAGALTVVAAPEAVQRATGEPLRVVTGIDRAFLAGQEGYDFFDIAAPAEGPAENASRDSGLATLNVVKVTEFLNEADGHGVRRWEHFVTGTEFGKPLLTGVRQAAARPCVQLGVDPAEGFFRGLGYEVRYEVRTHSGEAGAAWWPEVFLSIGPGRLVAPKAGLYLDEGGMYYRLVAHILPDAATKAANGVSGVIDNVIPTKNIAGVIRVESATESTVTAVPFGDLPRDPAAEGETGTTVAHYLGAGGLAAGDSIRARVGTTGDDDVYKVWTKNADGGFDHTLVAVTTGGTVVDVGDADVERLARGAAWVSRPGAARGAYFITGQYEGKAPLAVTIAGSKPGETTGAGAFGCTMVGNQGVKPLKVNDIDWGTNPGAGDVITIPSGEGVQINLLWNGRTWGRTSRTGGKTTRVTDDAVPPGGGFWYYRYDGGSFQVNVPADDVSDEFGADAGGEG